MENIVMNKKKYTGIIPPLVTPLQKDGSLDKKALQNLIEYDLKGGVHGFFVNGTSGEALRLSDSIWGLSTACVLNYTAGRVPVFCGAIDTSTSRTIERIKKIEFLGGQIAVCTPPFYLTNFGQDEILRHFDKICNSTSIEIAIYNIPETTHVNIFPETFRKLCQYPNIVAYKDSTADWQHLQKILMCNENLSVSIFNGAEELCAVSMLFGADGCIPGLANFMPELFVSLYNSCLSEKIKDCKSLQRRINALRKCIFINGCWMSGMKALLEIFHLGNDVVSTPLVALDNAEKEKVKEILHQNGYCNA